MADFHVQLALEYLQGRSTSERTPETLQGIVGHVCAMSALSVEECARVQEAALRCALRRGLVPEEKRPAMPAPAVGLARLPQTTLDAAAARPFEPTEEERG